MGERAERLERRLQAPMILASALVIPALILEGADVSHAWKTFASVLNWAIWLAFLGELVAMLAVVRSRRGYLAHNPLTLAIVVLTPPFLPALFQSLRALRLLRVARLLRLAPMFKAAFTLRGVQYASLVTGLVAIAGAAAFENAEPAKDYFDGFYWAISTMATVGYGDELPSTSEAKVLAMVLMLVGIGYFAIVTGALAERVIERGQKEEVNAHADDDVSVQLERLGQRGRELVAEVDALRPAIARERRL
jgi:voltage-gated potassium channel